MFSKIKLKKLCKLTFIGLILFLLCPIGYFVLDNPREVKVEPRAVVPNSVGAYIINLDRSQDRYQDVRPLVHDLEIPFERLPAVNGYALSEAELKNLVDFKTYQLFFKEPPKNGTIGCTLSHIKAWEAFLKSNFEYAIIFEDDVVFEPTKLRSAIDELIKHSSYWDINNFEIHHRGLPITIKKLKDDQKLVNYLFPVTHTGAYMINRKAAIRLLEKALPIKMPVDHYFTRTWELGLIFTGVENPRLVHQKEGFSEIENSPRIAKSTGSATLKLKQKYYACKTSIIRMGYNLKCALTSHDV